jgi:hypothetical protein
MPYDDSRELCFITGTLKFAATGQQPRLAHGSMDGTN